MSSDLHPTPTPFKFTKMQGAGNDFLVFDGIHQHIHFSALQWRHLADRHFGVGADQMLVVEASTLTDVDFKYRIFNADGHEVEHCGNGARAFVKFVHEKGLTQQTRIKVEVMKGVIELVLEADGNVTVNMNTPVLEADKVPFDTRGLVSESDGDATLWPLQVGDNVYTISALSMGNPHAVQIVADVDATAVATIGPLIERHPRFGEGVNAGFMQIIDPQHIKLRVYERGAGETLACGTGACAAVVAGILRGRLTSPVTVHAKGGDLGVRWDGMGQPVFLSGPAVTVFEGEFYL